ncbi:ExbD/TolR family protein [Ramlibacter tataouinensis]|uniref:Candidate biopolymer transport protein n=1 Tax=Ramlibacter tataouinensis (strain ATCC BAA-407 / DSM 14655 / LMG 21543 / TTB310) TaxID=365046 RepID=F5Y416_RAMTT|nr:biopolymer transporter ExbD [Ramlibacter tataouinensis]AEG91294.1 Candidate biopolymer transport protein [Ramlibacter tataouinensis TTB310]
MSFGRMSRTPGAQPMSEINVTPLVDVMLVLVVIFIVTAPLLASSVRLDLPSTEAAQPGDASASISVAIDARGQLFVQDKPVTAPQLAQQLAEAARRNPDTEVQLRADQAVPYGRVVEVMGAAQQAGLNRIGFVAEPGK